MPRKEIKLKVNGLEYEVKIGATDTPTTASAPQSRYVSDNIYTFLHRGPGKQYRIIGSINAGEAVTQLAQSEDGK